MAGKADFTADERSMLCKSPMLAGMVVVAASPSGPFGVIKEMIAMGKLVAETKAKGGEGLVSAVVDALSKARLPIDLSAMILAIARVESGFNPFSENPASTACGIFQFVEAPGSPTPTRATGASIRT